MTLPIEHKQQLIDGKEILKERCVLMFHCGMSYKAINEQLGLSFGEIAQVRRECGFSTKDYRNATGPLGKVVAKHAKLTPVSNVKQIIQLFTKKQLTGE